MSAFCNVTPSCLVGIYRHFIEAAAYPKDGGSGFLKNVGKFIPDTAAPSMTLKLIQRPENLRSHKRGFNLTQFVHIRVMISAVFTHTSQYKLELGRTVSTDGSGGSVQQK